MNARADINGPRPVSIRPNQAPDVFGISPDTHFRWSKKPDGPKPFKPTDQITLFLVADIEDYIRRFPGT